MTVPGNGPGPPQGPKGHPFRGKTTGRIRPRSTGESIALFFGLLAAWCGGVTLVFMAIFDNFWWRLTHPLESGWHKGSWGFVFLYALLSIPVFPLYSRLDDWLEARRRGGA